MVKNTPGNLRSASKQPDYYKRLKIAVLGILIVSLVAVVSLTFFAPQIGYLLGFLSVHRNDPGEVPLIKPNTPVFSNPPTASKDDKVTLQGYAQKGMKVKLFVNGPEKEETTVDNDGIFTFSEVKLIPGRNTLFAKVEDSQGNESDKSQTLIIILDKEKPEIEIDKPKDNETIKNLDKRIEISGKINEKAQILINDRMVIQKPDYSYEYLLGVNEGWIEIKVKAIDEAGNDSIESIKVKYEQKSH
ncbi:hypothetical protein JXA34_01320 [Patescibacteria group bacterium]|nr:hypothetical protein [Patescibacteria group bacterium]